MTVRYSEQAVCGITDRGLATVAQAARTSKKLNAAGEFMCKLQWRPVLPAKVHGIALKSQGLISRYQILT